MPSSVINDLNPYKSLIRTMFIFAVVLNIASLAVWMVGLQFPGFIFGLFALMVSVLIVVFFLTGKKAAVKIRALVQGEGLLARWEYPGSVFRQFIVSEYQRQMTNANITAGVILIAGPFVGLFKDGSAGLPAGIAVGAGLALFAYLLGFAMAKDFHRKALTPPHEAYLSASCVYVNGMFIDWSSYGAGFVSAEIKNDELTGWPCIFITYTVRGRYGRQTKDVYIPIPDGKIHEAQRIITQFV